MGNLVPEQLTTERLLLRRFTQDDWIDLHQYYVDKIATEFTVGRSLSASETLNVMTEMDEHWQIHGYGPYAIEEQATHKVLGTVGFWYPADFPSAEIKWALNREYWGHGFAREAARAVQQVGAKYLTHISLLSLIRAENIRSIKLAEAIGAKFAKPMVVRDINWQVYYHPDNKKPD